MTRVSGAIAARARVAGHRAHPPPSAGHLDQRRSRPPAPVEQGVPMADATAAPDRTSDGQPALKRVMGPGLLLLFIVGDVLGTGIYALTGQVAAQVGGVVWLPFLVAFLVALVTAFSYLELVTKYPQAAGAALYTHKAFGVHFVTFLVAFARSEEHTSELQSRQYLVCRLLLVKKTLSPSTIPL